MYMLARVRKIFCILSIPIYKESKFQSAFFPANLPSPVAVPFGLVSAVASSVQVCRGEKENKKLSRVPNAKPPFPFPIRHQSVRNRYDGRKKNKSFPRVPNVNLQFIFLLFLKSAKN